MEGFVPNINIMRKRTTTELYLKGGYRSMVIILLMEMRQTLKFVSQWLDFSVYIQTGKMLQDWQSLQTIHIYNGDSYTRRTASF